LNHKKTVQNLEESAVKTKKYASMGGKNPIIKLAIIANLRHLRLKTYFLPQY
jgi:hypothetical protein